MSWFQTTNFASLAKSALKEAQKTIDKALDISDENSPPPSTATTADVDPNMALTESEIHASTGIRSSLMEADENAGDEDDEENESSVTLNMKPVMVNSSLSDSLALESEENDESKWSTIEVETVETSHSRNSSISTIPDTNSTSSPDRDIERYRNVYVNEQMVPVLLETSVVTDATYQHDVDSSSTNNVVPTGEDDSTTLLASTENNCSNASSSTLDGDVQTIVENDVESQSSSSFEQVSTPSDHHHLPNQSCPPDRTASPSPGSTTMTQLTHPGSHNKFVSKIKTNASSASSSDIEVIPLDPEEQTISKIFQEVETQTDDNYFQNIKLVEKEKTGKSVNNNVKTEEAFAKLTSVMEDKLKDKDKEIEQLRLEGEKLSKKQYDISTVIKKLRAKEKETESTVKGLKAELAEKGVELERLMKVFVSKEGVEQAQGDQIAKVNAENRKLEVEIERLKSELEDAVENCNSMKISVENSALEILESKNIILATQRDAAEVDQLKRERSEMLSCNETLQKEVDRLRTVVNETQKHSAQREQELKSQLVAATAKCHQLENEISDISSDIADATMPLSLEIEKLQYELKSNQAVADKRESALVAKLSDLEQKIVGSEDRESSYALMEQSYQNQIQSVETKVDQLENENKKLKALSQELKLKLDIQERDLKSKLDDSLTEFDQLKTSKEAIEAELRNEQTERKKIQQLLEQHIRNNQNTPTNNPSFVPSSDNHNNNMSTFLASSSASVSSSTPTTIQNPPKSNSGLLRSGENSPSNHSMVSEASYLDEVFDPSGQNNRSMTPKSFFESFSSASMIENLHSQLRLRDGEVHQLHEDSMKNERIRKTLNEEIAQLTLHNQELLMQMEALEDLQKRMEEVEKKYNTVLQLYGEKVEEAEELRLDLEDVKKMYTEQIDKLFER